MNPSFVHLRLHSEFSLIDGLVRVKPLVKAVAEQGMPAVAITDFCNLFALVKFQKAAKGAGVKPIFGSDLMVKGEGDDEPSPICLLAQNLVGYKNITEIISEAYLHGQHLGVPLVTKEVVAKYAEGLIMLSAGRHGDIGKALFSSDSEQECAALADAKVSAWKEIFPDRLYLELQRTGRDNEETYLHKAVELAYKHQLPVVATNDVRFLAATDFEAHEVRVCIHDGCTLDDPRREKRYSEQQYLRSADEMAELFSDIPEALENSVEIAKRCNVDVPLGKNYLPNYPIPEGMTMDEFFRQISQEGLDRRLEGILDKNDPEYAAKRKDYDDRLEEELGIIIQMGFPGYFLIVMDFIKWAKRNDVPVGPGRGSGAGSLVAYVLDITDLDPLEYDLLFERFLNPERVSMPDFDVDFCMDGRDRVIDYVADNYGRDAVSQIITFGTMAAKAVVRDVGRVQGKAYGFVDRISKLIPFEVGMTLNKALEDEPQLKDLFDNDEDVRELLEMALKLEGVTRNVGKHAGGVVIAPSKLTDFSPLYCDETGGNLVTQYDKDDVEQAGLVKFDFLGLRTLTIVDWALQHINRDTKSNGGEPLDIATIDIADKQSFELLMSAETTAVFQLESRGMKDLIKRLQPNCFEDIIALVALFRPGPLQSGMVDDFINRKHGRAEVAYPHPDLEPVLENTYGVILYQEQVMQIAQVLAGYTLGGADMLRRAMGKKKPEEMAKQRLIFNEGTAKNNIDEETSNSIFDLMEKFAGYGFNKSHSAAYALVSFQTIWLKAHYPSEFMAAVLSADMHNTDKIVTLVDETRSMELALLPPDVSHSDFKFNVNEEGEIVYGLGAIKGVGEGPIESIVEARESGGPFVDLFDFCRRIDLRRVNRRCFDALIKSGALDKLGPLTTNTKENRAVLMASLDEAIKAAEQHRSNEDAGMGDLFGDVEPEAAPGGDFTAARSWSDDERLQGEKETLGLFLTGHPIDQYEEELRHFVPNRIADLKPTNRGSNTLVSGLIIAMRVMKNKKGTKMAFVTLDDKSGRLEVSLFSKVYEEFSDLLTKDNLLVVEGEVSMDEYSGGLKMVARGCSDIAEARESHAKEVLLKMNAQQAEEHGIEHLGRLLKPYKEGKCRMVVDYQRSDAFGRFVLGEEWKVQPNQNLINRLKETYGRDSVQVVYQ